MGTEIIEVIEVIDNPMVNSWLTAGKTVGLLIILIAVTIITLARTGVINKYFDLKIQALGLSTGFDKNVLKEFRDTLTVLLANDKQTKDQIAVIGASVSRNTEAIKEIKEDVKETKIETLKKAIFDKSLYLIDRMAAGIRYLQEGCNSEAGEYLLNQLCFEDLVEWNGVCKLLKAPQYWRTERDRPENWKTESPKRSPRTERKTNGTVDAA